MNKDLIRRKWSEQLCMKRITNDDLVCRDCLYRYDDTKILGNTSKCEMYDDKPDEILIGGQCDWYDKEES